MSDQFPPIPPPAEPETEKSWIKSWSLHFRGEAQLKDGNLLYKPVLNYQLSSTEWKGDEHDQNPSEPLLMVWDAVVEPVCLHTQPEGGHIATQPPWIEFHNSGYLANVNLMIEAQDKWSTRLIGSTEDLSLRATLRNDQAADLGEGKLIAAQIANTSRAEKITLLSTGGQTVTAPGFSPESIEDVRPIIYLEQAEGFVLLAELIDGFGNRRVLFSVHIREEVGSRQHWIVSRPYFVLAPDWYTLRVHQDGDISQPMKNADGQSHRYFEFWVNNLPLGIYRLPSINFPFKNEGGLESWYRLLATRQWRVAIFHRWHCRYHRRSP
jgi:hypothetical protein